jgi:hypothetical protein
MSPEDLAQALLAAVRAQGFEHTADPANGGRPLRHFPSLDLGVIAFTSGGPVAANVLFSREHPQGLVAPLPAGFAAQSRIAYLADLQDAEGVSIAWRPESDWSQLPFRPLHGEGPRFVAPYPASLLKLMVAVGLGLLLDAGAATLDEAWTFQERRRSLRDWQFDMLAVSCNDSTSALVALLHARQGLEPLRACFRALDLPTLRLDGTQPDGGWGNAAGAGVGRIQMTAWDTLRLLWWLDPGAPPPPWTAQPPLGAATRQALWRGLEEQGLDIVLSSASLAGLPGWREGIPNALHPRWQAGDPADGSRHIGGYRYPRPEREPVGRVHYAHKIGNTENYAADAGRVRGPGRHYLVALLSNLGQRYAPQPGCAGPWGLAGLGAAIDAFLA